MSDQLLERREQVYSLLVSLEDPYPGIKTWTGSMVDRNAKRGESPGPRVKCGSCQGDGIVKRGRHVLNCTRCGGDEQKKGRGFFVVDDYTRREVGSTDTRAISRTRQVMCDRCGGYGRVSAYSRSEPPRQQWRADYQDGYARWELTRPDRCEPCAGSGRLEIPDHRWIDALLRRAGTVTGANGLPADFDGIDERRAQMADRGSYSELRTALRWLERNHEDRHRAVVHLIVYAEKVAIPAYTRDYLDETVDLLADRMPDQIRVPREHRKDVKDVVQKDSLWHGRTARHSKRREQRDQEIRALRDAGRAASWIAERYDVTERQVRRICQPIDAIADVGT